MYQNMFYDSKVLTAVAPQVINNTHVDGSGIVTAGVEGVAFACQCGDLPGGSVASFKVQESDDDVDAHYADIAGASQAFTDADDNKTTIIDIKRPQKAYLRLVATNGAAFAAYMSGVAIQYGLRTAPVTQSFGGAFKVDV